MSFSYRIVFLSKILFCISHLLEGSVIKKNLPVNAGDTEDTGSIPESGRSPGGGNDTPLQDSCQENPMDRGAGRAIVHGVAMSRTQLSD